MIIMEQMQDSLGSLLEMFKGTEIGESLEKELSQINKDSEEEVYQVYKKYAPLLDSQCLQDRGD